MVDVNRIFLALLSRLKKRDIKTYLGSSAVFFGFYLVEQKQCVS